MGLCSTCLERQSEFLDMLIVWNMAVSPIPVVVNLLQSSSRFLTVWFLCQGQYKRSYCKTKTKTYFFIATAPRRCRFPFLLRTKDTSATVTRLGVLLAVLGSSMKGKQIRGEERRKIRTRDTNQFTSAICNPESNIVDKNLMASCRICSGGDHRVGTWTLCISKYFRLFILGLFLFFKLARSFHILCSVLCFPIVDGRVDQLHVAIVLYNPAIASRRWRRNRCALIATYRGGGGVCTSI